MTRMVSWSKFCASFDCWVSCRPSTRTICDSFDAITWGEADNHAWMYPFTCNDNREACMILSIKLHTLEVTSSSMTLRVLNLVQLMNWRLLGSSLKRSLQKLSWRISCMQFGILLYPFTVLADLASCRYCIPMDSPRPILPAELEFFNKGTGRGKSQWTHISSCWFWRLLPLIIVTSFTLANLPQNWLGTNLQYTD